MFVLVVLALMVTMFIGGWIRADLVAVIGLVVLVLAGQLTVAEATAGFSNSVVLMIAGLFIVGAGLFHTGVAERIGGLPSLTAAIVICSGIVGAALGPALLTLLGVTDWRARGLAIGTAAHGIGTARAISVNEVAGAFSGLAMGLNALATALLLPLLWQLFFG